MGIFVRVLARPGSSGVGPKFASGSDTVTNKGALEATNGGNLSVGGETLTYQSGASYSVGAGSTFSIGSDTFLGGQFAPAAGEAFVFVDSNNAFDGSTSAGAATFAKALDTGGYNVTLKGAVHNQGALAVRTGAVVIDAAGVTLDSGGAATKGPIVLAGDAPISVALPHRRCIGVSQSFLADNTRLSV